MEQNPLAPESTSLALDTVAYRLAVDKIKDNGVDMKVGKHSAEGTVNSNKAQTLITTIPYDEGWSAKIDGKKSRDKSLPKRFCQYPCTKGQTQSNFQLYAKRLYCRCCFLHSSDRDVRSLSANVEIEKRSTSISKTGGST